MNFIEKKVFILKLNFNYNFMFVFDNEKYLP